MTYSQLINRISDELDVSKAEAGRMMKDLVAECTEQLGDQTGFTIPGLGTFKTKVREVKKVYNPHHRKYMLIPPKQVVEFSPAKGLKETLKFSKPEK